MAETFDVIIIGAGIAGASAGAWLVGSARVLMLEAELRPGYHTTGRSAATFIENYGAPSVRILNRASADFLRSPPEGFADAPVASPRGLLYVASKHQLDALDEELAGANGMQRLDATEAAALVPALASGATVAAGYEPGALDLDVDLLHQGYLRQFRNGGGRVECNARVEAMTQVDNVWEVRTGDLTARARVVVNAAGAWGDVVAGLAGVKPLGLMPLRRSIAVVEVSGDSPVDAGWPLIAGVAGDWYAKAESTGLLVSPADETPSEPCDAYPEDIDLAEGLHRMGEALGFSVTRMVHSWAGLRTFAPDRQLVNGFDASVDSFYWLVGQGGYGIQTSPAMGRVCAENVARFLGRDGQVEASGMTAAEVALLDPARLR